MEFTDAPLKPFGEKLLDMAIPSQLSLKTPVVFRMVKELKAKGCLPWTGSHRAELCFDEALTNAIVHGNKLDPTKKVRIILFADAERWGAIIEDDGEGLKPENVPNPNDPEYLFRESGRGILLMDSYLDKLLYSRKGNRLMMMRRRQAEPEPAEAEAALAAEDATAPVSAREGSIGRSQQDGIEVVYVLSERLTEENAADLREAVIAAVERCPAVLVDMAPVTYISSRGLGVLVGLYKHTSSKKALLMLTAVQPAVMDILKSANIMRLFKVIPDRRTALAELKKMVQ